MATGGVTMPPRDHMAMSGDTLGCHNCGQDVLLAFSGMRSRVLLNVLQYIGRPPGKRVTQPKMSIVLRLSSPVLNHSKHFQKQKDIGKCSFQLSFEMDANPFIKP